MVIPSINVPNFLDAERQIRLAESFLSKKDGWIHIDVSDGVFSKHISWGDALEFETLNSPLKVEVHLMVDNPETAVIPWLKIGVNRVIVHIQSLKEPKSFFEICEEHGVEVMISADLTQTIESIAIYKNIFNYFQILSVLPGASGQKPFSNIDQKIRTLREVAPTATIEVDGGVTIDNASILVNAGANILVSGNYIFGNSDPSYAYKQLVEFI